tara:strand:- start:1526 stop:2302 length:777 start_codon:yes stop_codon:yes gene_type:complete
LIVTVCQLDNISENFEKCFYNLEKYLSTEKTDLLLLPEMPFSEWLSKDKNVDKKKWENAVKEHDHIIKNLSNLNAEFIIGSRPIINNKNKFLNEAFLFEKNKNTSIAVHEKYYLPNDEGFWEETWYSKGNGKFDPFKVGEVLVGLQICTDMWFFHHAREFANQQIQILCVPRATPYASLKKWTIGGKTAAMVSGSYCISSNLYNPIGNGADLGGIGWIISPEGEILNSTNPNRPFVTMNLDLNKSTQAKKTYPRYVKE